MSGLEDEGVFLCRAQIARVSALTDTPILAAPVGAMGREYCNAQYNMARQSMSLGNCFYSAFRCD
jgi:hypothetical protein